MMTGLRFILCVLLSLWVCGVFCEINEKESERSVRAWCVFVCSNVCV